jgi:acyl-CoA thioester hydrolase
MAGLLARTFRIRHYECDAYGHLNNTAYLRYLDEVEIEAGVAGWDDWRWAQADITYVEPVGFGDSVEVIAETDSESPSHLLRRYRFESAGRQVATAVALWSGLGDASMAMDPVPEPPPPPSGVFRHRRRVHWQDVGETSQASPATLSAYAEDCGIAVCDAHGWPLERCSKEGFAIVLRRHQIAYGRPAQLGEELDLTTWASDRSRASAIRHYVVEASGEPVARFRSHYVWVDAGSMRPIRVPIGFLDEFRANFSD